jgi:hypothetical protein
VRGKAGGFGLGTDPRQCGSFQPIATDSSQVIRQGNRFAGNSQTPKLSRLPCRKAYRKGSQCSMADHSKVRARFPAKEGQQEDKEREREDAEIFTPFKIVPRGTLPGHQGKAGVTSGNGCGVWDQ